MTNYIVWTASFQGMALFAFLAFLSASLELAFQVYMKKGMIFEFWKKIIKKMHDKGGIPKKLSMVLGVCQFCNGFWIAFIVYLRFFGLGISVLLFTSLSFFFLFLFSRVWDY